MSAALLDSGAVPFVGKLKTGLGKVTGRNDLGLWWATADGSTLLLREGQELEIDGESREIRAFDALTSVPGSPGHGRLAADAVPVRVRFRDGGSAVLVASINGLDLRAVTGEAVPGVDGFHFAGLGIPALNNEGRMAFAATLKSGKERVSGVFADQADDDLLPVALQEDDAPGAAGAKFAAFQDPVYNAQEHVAFVATLAAGNSNRGNTKGIWWNGAGALQLVARAGDPAPGIEGATFVNFTSLALPDGENAGPIFLAEVKVVQSLKGNKQRVVRGRGLWAVGTDGVLRLVVREGDSVGGKTLKKLTVLNTISGSPAQSRSYNAAQQIVYSGYFDDGTQTIVKVQLP